MNKGVVFALVAAIIWGIDYALADRVLKSISVYTLVTIEMFIGTIVFSVIGYNEIINDVTILKTDHQVLKYFIIDTIGFNIGFYLICKSIQSSNAAVAGLIEISYPIFIIIASWLFFRENHLTLPIIIGGIFIFIGLAIIGIFSHGKS